MEDRMKAIYLVLMTLVASSCVERGAGQEVHHYYHDGDESEVIDGDEQNQALSYGSAEDQKEKIEIKNIKFKSQSPPGDWAHNMNCGPTTALMLAGYYHNFTPETDGLEDLLDWLYDQNLISAQSMAGAEYYDGNSTNTYDLIQVLENYYQIGKINKKNSNDLNLLKKELRKGNPVIVAVNIRMDTGLGGHFMLIVGLDEINEQIIVHDPGRTEGAYNKYDLDKFQSSWATSSYASLFLITPDVTWHPNGTLVKKRGANQVYQLINGQKSWILDEQVFHAHNFNWEKVIEVSDLEMNCFDEGFVIDWQPYREVLQVGEVVYLIEKQSSVSTSCAWYEFASYFAYETWQLPQQIQYLSFADADQYYFQSCNYSGQLFVREGTVIKPTFTMVDYGQGVVFVAEPGGQLKYIESEPIYQQLGYDKLQRFDANQEQFYSSHQQIIGAITIEDLQRCQNGSNVLAGDGEEPSDLDNDGFSVAQGDCNDTDEEINPLAVEYCDGFDNNCNHLIDDQAECPLDYECINGECQLVQEFPDGDELTEIDGDEDLPLDGDLAEDGDDDWSVDGDSSSDDFPEEDGDEIETPSAEDITCTISCPNQMKAHVWYGESGYTAGQSVELAITAEELCLRGQAWLDFNCACQFPYEWACHYWPAAQIECNQIIQIMHGVVDYNGEGEIWFTDIDCH